MQQNETLKALGLILSTIREFYSQEIMLKLATILDLIQEHVLASDIYKML